MANIPNKYLSPITVEAEMFLNSLQSLSKQYHNIDVVLVSALEKVMNAIEGFLDSDPTEIVETDKIKLVESKIVKQVERIFVCGLCKRDIGKSVENIATHMASCSGKASNEVRNRKEKTVETAKKGQLPGGIKLTKKTVSMLTTNFDKFIEEQARMGAKLKCIPAYDKIEQDLLNLATPLFPNKKIRVYSFGSRIAGLAHRNSDLDIFMDIGGCFHVFQNRADAESVQKLRLVEKSLKKNKSWKCMRSLVSARVPILKVIHNETGIECDINFSNSLGVINSALLEYLFNLQPIAQLLCCYMKKWLMHTRLCEDINTYSMNLMVLFYLQTLNLMPSIERLQKNVKEDKALKVGDWLCVYGTYSLSVLNIQPVSVNVSNMLKYIRNFFVYYTKFKYESEIICPYLGSPIKKFNLEKLMPHRYTNYIKKFPDYALDMEKPIIVQDPLQLNHNTTRNVRLPCYVTLKQTMSASLKLLDETFPEDNDDI